MIMIGVNSYGLTGEDSVGSVLTGSDNTFVLFRSVKTISVVKFYATILGMLVNIMFPFFNTQFLIVYN